MDRLTPEIIQEIISHIRLKRDLMNLWLVQRSLADLIVRYLSEEVMVQPSKKSLSGLLESSQRPNLARHVKIIFLRFDSFSNSIDKSIRNSLACALRCKNTSNFGTQYPNIMEPTLQDLQKSPQYTVVLSTAFQNLPQLESIEVGGEVNKRVEKHCGIGSQLCLIKPALGYLPWVSVQNMSTILLEGGLFLRICGNG